MRADAQSGKGKLVAAGVGVLVVVAVAGYLVVRKPWGYRAPPIVVRPVEGDKNKTVDAIINQWRLNYPEVEGQSSKQSKAWVDSGEELLLKDTTGAYLDAEEEFQKAIVVDPSNGRAIAGWVLAIAFGRGGQIDDQTARSAEAMLQAAEASRSCDPRVYVAHAHLMIARGGNPNDIKVLADRGRTSSNAGDKALAALADGQTLLTKNPQQADTRFKEALQLDPKLKRGYFFQAKLAISQGRYKEAADVLERRLELDKDQWEAAEELARLYVEVGEPARARKVLEAAKAAAPTAGRPRLSLAILAYQHLNEASLATEQLLALTQDKEVPSTERAQAWVHLAAIYRAGGETQKAADALEHALESTPDSVPAHLQNFLVLLERGVTSSARLELDGLKGKLNDPQLEATLEGRLEIAENRLDDAVKTLSAVYEADHRRVDALLLAGAASARARKDGKAWEFCLKKGLRVDPLVRPVPAMTALYVRPADLLKPAVGAFEALSPKSDEDPNPSLCEGLVAWFSEDFASADKALSRVNVIDPRNAEAYAYRAFIAMHRKDLGGAAKLAGRGLDSSKSTADVYLALAMLQMQSGKPDAAKASAANAQKYNPALYSAKTLQAEASSKLKDNDAAREGLTKVLLYDSLYSDAKRVLFKQGL
jgi:tetratricopeptide (TPR) repeat protein